MSRPYLAVYLSALLISACGGSGSDNESKSLLAFDGTSTTLIDGIADTGQYGDGYGNNGALSQVVFGISNCHGPVTLDVRGYDIDRSTEVAVLLNNNEIGNLSKGRGNNRLNNGDSFQLNLALGSINTITFKQNNAGEKWGVTNILLSGCISDTSNPETNPPTGGESNSDSIELSSTVNTIKYGHNYGDSTS